MITEEAIFPYFDIGGTFVFAISGALSAVNRKLDLFGVFVLAFVVGNCGGIARDLLIGAVPPSALSDSKYVIASTVAGLITFLAYRRVTKLKAAVRWVDAVGLSFFAVAGAEKALEYGLSPSMAALLGMLTGIGGGMMRDALLTEVPQVLVSDLYAIAALAGAFVVVLGHQFGISYDLSAPLGGAVCFSIRFMAIRFGWHLPSGPFSLRKALSRSSTQGQAAPPDQDQ